MIFIDLGAWNGASIKYVRKNISNSCRIIAFEPLPDNIAILKDMQTAWGFDLVEAAVSDYDGRAKFYTGQTESGSLSDKKRTGGLNGKNSVNVDVVDFALWFYSSIVGPADHEYLPHITIKMNIEGAEYEILDKMHKLDLLPYVSKWYIQWHWQKIMFPESEHKRISNLIKWEPWLVM